MELEWHWEEYYRVHNECGGEIWFLENREICDSCGEQEELNE